MKVIRRLLGGVIILSTLLSLTACSPAPYPIAFTRSGDKLEVYVPTCAGWSVDWIRITGQGPEDEHFYWEMRRTSGPGTKYFVFGEEPTGYKTIMSLNLDVSPDYEMPEFPLDYSYAVGVSLAPFQEVPDFEVEPPRIRLRNETYPFEGADAVEGVWKNTLSSSESLDELDEYLQRFCPAS
jgi:hypothetical protein